MSLSDLLPTLCESPLGCSRHVEPGTDYCLVHQHHAPKGGENES